MEPAERIESGSALGKRPRTKVLPRTASLVTVPSAAKQGRRQERAGAGVPSSSSLPAGGAGIGAGGGGGAVPSFYYGPFTTVETAAFLKACGLCNRRLGPGYDTFIYRFGLTPIDLFTLAFRALCIHDDGSRFPGRDDIVPFDLFQSIASICSSLLSYSICSSLLSYWNYFDLCRSIM
jgi:hypothetical protein